MKSLGEVADKQTPALQDLDASAQRVTSFLDELGPFAAASRPAIRSLGQASITGDRAVKAAAPTVGLLDGVARGTPEVAKDLSLVLGHLDDRGNAVEKDPRSPGGQGYTGFEALLQYVYDQTTSTATYDANSHIFKIALFASKCGNYANAQSVKNDPSLIRDCSSYLGPTQPGITTPDATRFDEPDPATARRVAARRTDRTPPPAPAPPAPAAPSAPAPQPPANEPAPAPPTVPGVGGAGGVTPPGVPVPPVTPPSTPALPQLPNVPIPCVPPLQPPVCTPAGTTPPAAAAPAQSSNGAQSSRQLLDYLLKP